uniref:Uncharacterized protein n=1 Tax=Glossina morsitans morsitans TaxID=37546 RepID=A0A1B0G2W8_GLOMM
MTTPLLYVNLTEVKVQDNNTHTDEIDLRVFLRGPQQFSASSDRSLHDVHECEGVTVNWKKATSEKRLNGPS